MGTSSEQVADATAALDAALDALVSLDLGGLPAGVLTGLVRSVARAESRLASVTARAAAAADRAGAVDAAGAASMVSWLADATGRTGHSASRTVALGRAIDVAPRVAAGLADGTLTTDKAATLARAIDRGVLDVGEVDDLAEDASRLPAGLLARHVRAAEARADNARLRRDERWARQRRTLTTRRRDDGSLEGRFLVDPVDGDVLDTALRALTTRDPAGTPPQHRRTRVQRHADALVELARHALDDGTAGEELTVRPHVTVVVPVAALSPDGDRAAAAGAVGTTDQGTVLSVQATRRLLCDAAVRRLVVDPHGRPLDVGRATRAWSGAQRAASAATDGGCRGPSCDRPFAWTHLHHIDWWTNGGHTDLDRGLPLCHHCHRLVHDDGWIVQLDPTTRTATWTSPHGHTTTTHPRGPATPNHLTSRLTSRLTRAATGDTDQPSGSISQPRAAPDAAPPTTRTTRPTAGAPPGTDRAARDDDARAGPAPPPGEGTTDPPRLFAPP